ncbi:MAG TPA: hypothetical protein VLM79_11130 [Kofleriaceae bacterium]|nr:hypothetical protein [Kofleriaceae bacterium]
MAARAPNRATWIAGAVVAVAATIAFAVGNDDWGRSLRDPTADAAYYYAYLPSLVLDRDLDFTNQYRVTGNWYRLGPTPRGRPGNVFGIGPAVFELPAFVVGHALARLAGARSDGFSRWETTPVLWTSIAFSLGAVWLAARLARRWVGGGAAWAGALLAGVSGPLLYYAIRQPGYAHPCAALFATLLLERWDASYGAAPRSLRTWIVLGAAAGAAALARPQLALWAALLPVAVVDDLRRRDGASLAALVGRWTAGAAAAALVFLPQLLAWKALYGAWYVVPQGPGFLRWDDPAWSEALFSSRNGLFPWAPLYAPMAIGLVILARDTIRLPLALLLGLFGQALVNGAAWDWWAGGSFGGRRFDSCYAAFALGAAVLIAAAARLLERPRRPAAILAGLALAAALLVAGATVQLAAMTSVNSARITGGEPASTVWRARIGGLRGRLAAWLSRASNLPVRAAFAWRHGVDLDAYDRRVGVHVLGDTYPGLNSYPDKLRDAIPGPGRMTAPRAELLVGINRRGTVALRAPIEAKGDVTLVWNDAASVTRHLDGRGTLELTGLAPRRGTNVLEIRAPAGSTVSTIEITAGP